MNLPETLLDEFAKATNDEVRADGEYTAYGKIQSVKTGNTDITVVLDGSNIGIPCKTSVPVTVGDRVRVSIKNHTAVITNNVSNPSTAQSQYNMYWADSAGKTHEVILVRFVYDNSGHIPTTDAEFFPYTAQTDDEFMVRQIVYTAPLKAFSITCSGLTSSQPCYAPAWLNNSDQFLKSNIEDAKETDALGKINKIRHRRFTWNETGKRVELGYVAQEMGKIDKNLEVRNEEQEFCAVDLTYLIALMTKSIQELSSEIEQLKGEINELKHNSESSD